MKQLHISPAPHERRPMTTMQIMLRVFIALLPAAVVGCLTFGIRAAVVIAVCILSSMFFEFLCRILMKRPQTITDLSAAVTGLLLGMNLPVDIPFWQAVVGSFVAIVVTKQLFGGLGQNFANPAIVARIVLLVSFQESMTTWRKPHSDAIASATPLVSNEASYLDLLLGNTAGCIGETCAIALILGGVYLLVRGIISSAAPIGFIGTFAICTFLAGNDPLYQVLSGGLLLGAIFMATDYVTTPITKSGKFLFGIGCGALTFCIRQFGGYPEGVSFSILLMNLLVPYLDRMTKTKPFGAMPHRKEAKSHE